MSDDRNHSIHPKKIFFLLLCVHAFLLIFSLLIPGEGWKVNDSLTLKFVQLSDLFTPDKHSPKDIRGLVAAVKLDTLTEEASPQQLVVAKADSNIQDSAARPLELANGRELDAFFEALLQCESDRTPLSIAYYGDSQVEGDRFSDYLRNRLQKQFGGGGPGLVTPLDISTMRITVQQSESKEWVKAACFGYPVTKTPGSRYGISGAFYRYRNGYYVTSREPKDSASGDTVTVKRWVNTSGNPWLSFRKSKLSYASVKQYTRATLWYSSADRVRIKVQRDGMVQTDTLYPATVGTKTWSVTDSTGHIRISFIEPGADIIGMALDKPEGVHVDNFSMRGSSGTDFWRMNAAYLAEQHRLRGTRLVVLQFGVNVVPYVDDTTEVRFYEQQFLQQLRLLKRQLPDVSVLVVGTTDISTKEGTQYVSYPFLEHIRDAQKRAAREAGCAFWDAFEAMGGRNSMPSWVFNNPPLAAKDFTHLSSRGANVLAQLLHEALMREFYLYVKRARNERPIVQTSSGKPEN